MNNTTTLARYAQSQGWHIEYTSRHLKFVSPEGKFVIIPATPSEWRGYQNSLAQLRQAGLTPPKKRIKKKVHRSTDGRAVAIANAAKVDLRFTRYPHIEEIMGQWRNESWFDNDGLPLSEEEWGRFSDEELVAALLLAPATLDAEDTAMGTAYALDPQALTDRPGDRTLFVRLCAYKFWVLHDLGLAPPVICWCGFTTGSFFDLAMHVVKQQERDDISHAPLSKHLIPWSDPNELRALMGEDTPDVEELRLELAGERDRRRAAEEELQALKSRLKGLVG